TSRTSCWSRLSASGEGTDITTSPASGGPRRPSSSAARRSTTIRPDATLGGGSARRYLSTAPPVGSCTITTASLVIARQAYRWHRRETRELHRRAGGPSTTPATTACSCATSTATAWQPSTTAVRPSRNNGAKSTGTV